MANVRQAHRRHLWDEHETSEIAWLPRTYAQSTQVMAYGSLYGIPHSFVDERDHLMRSHCRELRELNIVIVDHAFTSVPRNLFAPNPDSVRLKLPVCLPGRTLEPVLKDPPTLPLVVWAEVGAIIWPSSSRTDQTTEGERGGEGGTDRVLWGWGM